jgi:hypothetical protein
MTEDPVRYPLIDVTAWDAAATVVAPTSIEVSV